MINVTFNRLAFKVRNEWLQSDNPIHTLKVRNVVGTRHPSFDHKLKNTRVLLYPPANPRFCLTIGRFTAISATSRAGLSTDSAQLSKFERFD